MLEKFKNLKEIIIIGGGKSIEEGISLGLQDKLKDKCVIATNYSYKHFPHSMLVCTDDKFYYPKNVSENPDIYEELKKEPLIITTANIPKEYLLPNTIIIKGTGKYSNDPIKRGFYTPILCGIIALHLAEYLEPKNIFILGYDWDRRIGLPERDKKYNGHTDLDIHYYKKEIPHRGLGYVGFYENHNSNQYFKYFEQSKCKIYNVSLISNIENFSKISYLKMFNLF